MHSGKDTPVPIFEDPLADFATDANEEKIEVIADRYVVKQMLGQGGMGRVFRAHDKLLARDVAVKLLNRELRDDYFIRRFQQEARAASQLNHMNILCVLDFGLVSQTQPYLVMEWVDGAALDQLMERNGRFSIRHAVDISIKLTEGMQHAHRNGIIHRDLKPSNIMLSRSELGERVLILDFGIAKMVDDPTELGMLTMTGQIMGSPRCISPEQARGEPLDGRSDIYSLGCVMFEMFSGKPPYRGETAMTTIAMHLNEPIPAISEVSDSKFPDGLEELIRKTMAKRPEDRFASMAELTEQLKQLNLDSIEEEEPAPEEVAEITRSSITFDTKLMKRFAPLLLLGIVFLIVVFNQIASHDEHHESLNPSPFVKKMTEEQFTPKDLSMHRNVALVDDSEVTKQFKSRFQKARGLSEDDMVIDNSAKSGADLHKSLSSHPAAYHLRLYKVSVTADMVDVIDGASLLKELRFQSCVIPPDLQIRICKMKKLNALKFVDIPVSIAAIKQAAKLPELVDFQIYQGKVKDAALKEISTMTNLEVLEIQDNQERFSPAARQKLATLKKLKQLQLISTGLDDSDLAWISTLDCLTSLGLANNGPFSPRGLRQLADLKNLNSLYLENTNLNAAGLMSIAKIPNLQTLDISRNKDVTIGGLQHLAYRPNLDVIVAKTGIDRKNLKTISKELNIRLWEFRPTPGSSKAIDFFLPNG